MTMRSRCSVSQAVMASPSTLRSTIFVAENTLMLSSMGGAAAAEGSLLGVTGVRVAALLRAIAMQAS